MEEFFNGLSTAIYYIFNYLIANAPILIFTIIIYISLAAVYWKSVNMYYKYIEDKKKVSVCIIKTCL